MNNKDLTKKKNLDSEDIDTFKNLDNLHGSTNNSYDAGNQIINEENKKIYGNNTNLYSKDYVPSKNDVDNQTNYENKRFSTNEEYGPPYNRTGVAPDASMDSVLRDSINNSTNKEAQNSNHSKKWVYNSEKRDMY